MARNRVLATGAALALLSSLPLAHAAASAPQEHTQPKAETFFDDFSGDQLDRSKWAVEVTGENFQTVNSENQAYVDSPETIYIDHDDAGTGAQNGALALHPRFQQGFQAPDGQTYDFVSGRIKTAGKVDFTYGEYSARIKLPENATASGMWPAFWSLGSSIESGTPWPDCGEVDVMEHVGEPWTSSAMHGPEYHGDTPITHRQNFEGMDPAGWHTYSVDWTPEGFTFYVDDVQTYQVSKAEFEQNGWTWVFDDPQHMILNFALGGTYPQGVNGVTEPYLGLPQESVDEVRAGNARFLIDWVRVEQ
ncbi:glycoside hydrolase family 16 protein [Saccharopolyspora griseoalba]|uniref:Family 16 glycosylhydrolase n=1 Tax=Saccharopolyspora griseoalba TaxID=1431848 RepID=A0ABW2LHK5_9PSEU